MSGNFITKPRVLVLLALVFLGFVALMTTGLKYGLDFNGGTEFVITLDKSVDDPEVMSRITSTIAQRLDWSGLKDVRVSSSGGRFIIAQIATTDPEEIAKIEDLLQKQGKFENVFDSEVLFTGDDVISVVKTPQNGYGIEKLTDQGYRWSLPFILNAKAAKNFSDKVFHKCIPSPTGQYDCPKTYFFIDRPQNSLLLIPNSLYSQEEVMSADPYFPTSSRQVRIDEVLDNSNVPYITFDSLDSNTITQVSNYIKDNNIDSLVVPEGVSLSSLNDLNIKVKVVSKNEPYPWVWDAIGLKSVIWLTEGITNQAAASTSAGNFQTHFNLVITGSGLDMKEAQSKLEVTSALLSAGSLPVGVESISKETVSPDLGQNFLFSVLLMGIVALITVAIVVYIRYRDFKIFLPMMLVSAAEVYLIVCVASVLQWDLDLASLAGIIAAVGAGVGDQIIIIDEFLKNRQEKEHEQSIAAKIKRAFFIIVANASTSIATMAPILFFGLGLGKLVGFALTTITGVLIGVLITRPAYGDIVKGLHEK